MHPTYKEVIIEFRQEKIPIILPDLNGKIAELAYYKAECRGFEPGYELDDWLEAERELSSGTSARS